MKTKRFQRAKIKNCKKLSLRNDLDDKTIIEYFTAKDVFYVNTDKVLYDYRNTPMYEATTIGGKKGYVAKEGVDLIVDKHIGREHLADYKKA